MNTIPKTSVFKYYYAFRVEFNRVHYASVGGRRSASDASRHKATATTDGLTESEETQTFPSAVDFLEAL
jgi:hypothetical protein